MFKKILNSIFNYVDGLKLLVLFDKDGFVVEKCMNGFTKSEEISAEFSSVLKYIDKVTTFLVTGKMTRMVIECDNYLFYLHKINRYYYIVAVSDKSTVIGKLKYALISYESKIKKELDV